MLQSALPPLRSPCSPPPARLTSTHTSPPHTRDFRVLDGASSTPRPDFSSITVTLTHFPPPQCSSRTRGDLSLASKNHTSFSWRYIRMESQPHWNSDFAVCLCQFSSGFHIVEWVWLQKMWSGTAVNIPLKLIFHECSTPQPIVNVETGQERRGVERMVGNRT
ncbi:hypothetical protein AVEN_178494-1 [Araneus ventricosus]|uniref:Uncharacterized protein n=1 Tax=Araneus ventricosus TaxID=182803 RepID=A0A4Y2CDZ7_ARAVE|nr:hypothetical protein AVEN_178494-1 [Araneus ventricosus]